MTLSPKNFTTEWVRTLSRVTLSAIISDASANVLTLDTGVIRLTNTIDYRVGRGGRVFLIGNGGSLAIASHIATDFALANWPAIALTDAVALTSHTNDFGADANFSKQLELMRVRVDDMVIAMSCSGKSENILDAVRFAKAQSCNTITMSGFAPDNPLRPLGDLNFYIPANEYGFVQLAHESILHAACDLKAGWAQE